ncbi:hypothetical protein HDU76_002825, partial [Blyttiomyces sp. JEL0837]
MAQATISPPPSLDTFKTAPLKPFDLVLFKGGDAISTFIQNVSKTQVVHRLDAPFDAVWTHAGILLDHSVLPLDCMEEGKLYIYESVMAGEVAGITYSAVVPVDHQVPKGSFHLGPQLRLFSAVCHETKGDIAVIPLNESLRKKIYAKGSQFITTKLLAFHEKYSKFGYPMNPLEVLASASPSLFNTLNTVKTFTERLMNTPPAKQSVFCSELVALLLAELEVEGFYIENAAVGSTTPPSVDVVTNTPGPGGATVTTTGTTTTTTTADISRSSSAANLSSLAKAIWGGNNPAVTAPTTSSSTSSSPSSSNDDLTKPQKQKSAGEITPLDMQTTLAYRGSKVLYARVGEKVYLLGQNGADVVEIDAKALKLVFPSLDVPEENWVKVVRGVVPHGAKVAGKDSDDSPLYIGRVRMGRSIQIGGTCNNGILRIGWEGKEVRINYEHEVLHAWPNLVWVLCSGGNIPNRAVKGGSEEDGRPLYIARAAVNDKGPLGFGGSGDKAICLGKAAPHLGGASFGWKGKEVVVRRNYEVLVTEGFFEWMMGW